MGEKGSFLLTICFSHCARSATPLYKSIYAKNMKHDIKILGYIVPTPIVVVVEEGMVCIIEATADCS